METPKDRIRLFAEYSGLSQSAFERACGFSHGYVSNIRVAPSASARSLIARRFPNLNIEWLLSGAGEMLTSKASPAPVTESERTRYIEMLRVRDGRITYLERQVLDLQRKLDKFKNII